MVRSNGFLLLIPILASACSPMVSQSNRVATTRELSTPFHASPERAADIRKNYKRVKVGMSASELKAILN